MFIAMTGINFWALQYLQLTVTSSIFFSVPIIIALLSAPLLGEKLDARALDRDRRRVRRRAGDRAARQRRLPSGDAARAW